MIQTEATWGPLTVQIREEKDSPIEVFLNGEWVGAEQVAPARVFDEFVETLEAEVALQWDMYYAMCAEARREMYA